MELTNPWNALAVNKLGVLEHQKEHFSKIHLIIQSNHCFIDFSPMGSGKNYIVACISLTYSFPLFIICPVAGIAVWRNIVDRFEIPCHNIISYSSLRSKKGSQPKHGYLERVETGTTKKNGLKFVATEKFLSLAKQGILLVFDEFHNLKNESGQTKACRALTNACFLVGSRSRFALLSAFYMDDYSQTINLLRLTGFINHKDLTVGKGKATRIGQGMQDFINRCKVIDGEITHRIQREVIHLQKDIDYFCYKLFIEIILPKIGSGMTLNCPCHVMNAFIPLLEEDRREYSEAIGELAKWAGLDSVRIENNSGSGSECGTGAAAASGTFSAPVEQTKIVHRRIDNAKAASIAHLVKKDLENDPSCKVVIFINYKETMEKLASLLAPLNPLLVSGEVPATERPAIIEKFQEPNLLHRLLIINIKVGSDTISMDDTNGNFPRRVYIFPCYEIMQLHQAKGRFARASSKSYAIIYYCYGLNGSSSLSEIELSILNSLCKKTKVVKDTLPGQAQSGIKFPGDFEHVYLSL